MPARVPQGFYFSIYILAFALFSFAIPAELIVLSSLAVTTYHRVHSESVFQAGLAAYAKHDYLTAVYLYRKSYSEQKKELSLQYECAESAHNLAVSLAYLGLNKEAEEKFKEAIEIRRPYNDDIVATSLYQLGKLKIGTGKLAEAKSYLAESAAMYAVNLGESHKYTLDSRNLLNKIAVLQQH